MSTVLLFSQIKLFAFLCDLGDLGGLMAPVMTVLYYLWASPNTLVGLVWVLIARLTGGGWSIHTGVVEAHGGWVKPLLQRLPLVKGGALAITIGHVVLSQTSAGLDVTRTHERVHVRQYERWGPLFTPVYVLSGCWQWLRGNDPYRDNPFEVEAYAHDRSEHEA